MADEPKAAPARRGFFGFRRPGEYTDVGIATEIQIPWLTWLLMLLWMPFAMFLIWAGGWSLHLYDRMQKGYTASYWWRKSFLPWWDGGGWVLLLFTCIIVGWLIATVASALRMLVEQLLKQWNFMELLRMWFDYKRERKTSD